MDDSKILKANMKDGKIFQIIFDQAPVGMAVIDSQTGRFLNINEVYCRITGYSKPEMLEIDFMQITHPDDLKEDLDGMKRLLAREIDRYQMEKRYIRKDQQIVWVSLTVVPLWEENSEKLNHIAIAEDITARKLAEETIQQRESFLKSLLDAIPIPVFFKDTDGHYLGFNKSFILFFGKKEDELIGKSVFDINSQEYANIYFEKDNELFRTGNRQEYESQVQNASGDKRDVFFSKAVFHESDGKIGGIIGAILDVTERKKTERSLVESEQMMRYIIKHDPNALAVYDKDMCYLAVSDRYLQDYNIKEKDILGKHHYEVFPEMPQRWKDVHQRVLLGATESNNDDYFKRPDGSTTYNRWECRPWYTAENVIGGMITYTEVTTDRKMAEKALKAANRKLEMVIDFLPDPTFVIDKQGIVQMWNRAMHELSGIEPEHIIGKGDYEYALPFYGHKRPMLIDLVLNGDDRFEKKYFYLEKRPDGVMTSQSYHPDLEGGIYLFNTARVLYNADGTPTGAIESLSNISKIKRAEMALHESELKYRNLFSSIRDAILVADKDRKIVDCNPAFTDLFGYSETEILGKPTHFVYESEDQFLELGKKMKENTANAEFVYTVRYRKKSGDSFPGETGVYYLKNSDGDVTGFIGLIRNVEERLKAEEVLQQSRRHLKSLVDNLFDGVLVTDRKGIIQFANFAAQKLFGKEKNEIIGMDFGFPITLDEAFEIGIFQKDAGIRQVEARATTTDWSGEPAYLISLRDITQRVLAEEERDKINLQLQQSQKIESIGNLAGGIAHDFNNMLSIILSYGQELLEELHSSDPLHEAAFEIVEAGKRSTALTRQLLAFSRKQTLQPEVLNLNSIIQNIEKVLRRLIGEDIELKTNLAENLDHVKVDPGQIEQVIMNLAVNARDAMSQGGKMIIETANVIIDEAYTKIHPGAVPGNYTLLSITDTGCGMDKQTREKVFEPFFTTKDRNKGTGLGLSTVYGIVKQSGGNVWLYSEPGKGTTFKIYLPHTTHTLADKKNIKENNTIQGKKELILVVEDEPTLQKLCNMVLQKLNYRVKIASNGGEALLFIEEKNLRPDLILSDVVMPEMSGKDLVDRIKKTMPDLKVLYMSGYTDDAISKYGILDGGTPFIQKPFTKKDLGKKIRSILCS